MRLEDDPVVAEWLESLAARKEEFDWDVGNLTKNEKHGVSPVDVEDMFRNVLVFEGEIVEPSHAEPRWLLLGRTDSGRMLALIFTRRGERLRPISCRAMRPKERRRYEDRISEE